MLTNYKFNKRKTEQENSSICSSLNGYPVGNLKEKGGQGKHRQGKKLEPRCFQSK